MTISYFAYGSNMSSDVMAKLCPRHRCLGIASVADYRLAFTRKSRRTGSGVADIVQAPGQEVWGVLFDISDDELAAIDRKEGYDWAYVRITLPIRLATGGSTQTAITYTVRTKEPAEVPPSRQYLSQIIAAAKERGLPDSYIAQLEAVTTAKDNA
jgi:cation transport regulator ChaC